MRLLFLALAVSLTGSLYAADPELVSLAMPDAQVMAGVNLEQVRLSPLGQFLLAQSNQSPDAGLQKLIENTGFDPRRDLREMLVASNGQFGATQSLILARGVFDVPKIAVAAQAEGATIETYKGVTIIAKSKQGSMAFPDSTIAVVGDEATVHAAIDRKSAPSAISSALAVQVNQLSVSEDAWFVSLMPAAQLQGNSAAGGPLAMFSKVLQANGGVKFGANIVISLQAVSATDQEATMLATVLKTLASAASANSGNASGPMANAAAMLQNVKITAEGKNTTISLSVPESQIEQSILAAHPQQAPSEKPTQLKMRPAPPVSPEVQTGTPPGRIQVSREVQSAKLIQQSPPVYPPLAKQARIAGVVRLNAIIGKDGLVKNLTVASGHPLLVPAAMQAVKLWVYEPTLLNGQPVEVVTQVDATFELNP